MKEFLVKYSEEIGCLTAFKLLHNKTEKMVEHYDEQSSNKDLLDLHTMVEDLIKAKGMQLPPRP